MRPFGQLGPLLLHITVVIHYGIVEYYHTHYLHLPEHDLYQLFHNYGGRFKFLTVLNMIAQTIFFWICIVNDLFGTNEEDPVDPPFVRKLRDFLHATITLPLSLLVGSIFWTLWMVDRELVFPKPLDVFFPTWLNHSMHTSIMLYSLLHGAVCYNKYPSSATAVLTLIAVAFTYISWVFVVFVKTGMWVYPIFNVLNWLQRIVFLLSSVGTLVFQFYVGLAYNHILWGRENGSYRLEKKMKPA